MEALISQSRCRLEKERPSARLAKAYTGRSALVDKPILHADGRNAFGLDPIRAAHAALETGVAASHWNGHRAQLPLLQHALGQLTDFLTDFLPWHCILISRHRWRRDLRGAVGGGRAARLQPPAVAFYARVL